MKLTLAAGNVTAGQSFEVYAGSLAATNTLNVNASALNANLSLFGGAGNDTLVGGSGTNHFHGGVGADVLTATGGTNTFEYYTVGESIGTSHDFIIGFDALADKFTIDFGTPQAIDTAVTSGLLSSAHFDANLAATRSARANCMPRMPYCLHPHRAIWRDMPS